MPEGGIPAEEQQVQREPEPLEKVVGTLLNHPDNYEEDFKLLLENENFTVQQIEAFVQDQKWRNESKERFKQVWKFTNKC